MNKESVKRAVILGIITFIGFVVKYYWGFIMSHIKDFVINFLITFSPVFIGFLVYFIYWIVQDYKKIRKFNTIKPNEFNEFHEWLHKNQDYLRASQNSLDGRINAMFHWKSIYNKS